MEIPFFRLFLMFLPAVFYCPLVMGQTSVLESHDALLLWQIDTSGQFAPIPEPGESDWLANHEEPGQTFSEFLKAKKNPVTISRRTIYLQPLWHFEKNVSPNSQSLKTFTERYFQCPVKLLPELNPNKSRFSKRVNPDTKQEQLSTTQILKYLYKRVPKDAYCMLAIKNRISPESRAKRALWTNPLVQEGADFISIGEKVGG